MIVERQKWLHFAAELVRRMGLFGIEDVRIARDVIAKNLDAEAEREEPVPCRDGPDAQEGTRQG